jgi:hypothetical protein
MIKSIIYIPVDNPSDYWKISLYIVFLDHLVEEISKPDRLLDTLHATNHDLYSAMYSILLTMTVSPAANETRIFQCNETCEILLMVDYWRWTTVQLIITYAYTQICASRLGYDYWWIFINLYKCKTMNTDFMMNKSSENNLYHACILLSLLPFKFRRL